MRTPILGCCPLATPKENRLCRRNQYRSRPDFRKKYPGNLPWDIGKPQGPFIAAANQVKSPLLDCGCGTGNSSVFFAARGREATGTDFVEAVLTRWLGEPRRRSVAGKIGRFRRAKPCTFAIGWTALACICAEKREIPIETAAPRNLWTHPCSSRRGSPDRDLAFGV